MTTDTGTGTGYDDVGYDIDYGDTGPTFHRVDPRPARPYTPPDEDAYADPAAPDLDDADWEALEEAEDTGRFGRIMLGAGTALVVATAAGLAVLSIWGLPALLIGGGAVGAAGTAVAAGRAAARGNHQGNHRGPRGRGPGRTARTPRAGRGGMPRIPGGGRSRTPKLGGAGGKGKTPRGKAGGGGMPKLGGSKAGKGKTPGAGPKGGGAKGGPKGSGGPKGGGAKGKTPRGSAARGRAGSPSGATPRGRGTTPRATRRGRAAGFGLPKILGGRGVFGPGSARAPRTTRGANARTGRQANTPGRRRTWHNPFGIGRVFGGPGRARRAAARAAWYPIGLPLWLAGRWALYAPMRAFVLGLRRIAINSLRHDRAGVLFAWRWLALHARAWRMHSPRMQWWRTWQWLAHNQGTDAAWQWFVMGFLGDKVRAAKARGAQWWRWFVGFDAAEGTVPPEPAAEPAPTPERARRRPEPFDPYQGREPAPDMYDDVIDSDTPDPAPRTRRRSRQAPPDRSAPTGTGRTNQGDPMQLMNGAMHPALARWVEAWEMAVVGFSPKSIPDLNRYLNSQPTALIEDAKTFDQVATNLSGRFPGAVLIDPFFRGVSGGIRDLATSSHSLFEAWRTIHADDIARHEAPRVNEHLADVARHLWGGTLPALPDGSVFHERLAMVTGAGRDILGGYFPGEVYFTEDAVVDLMWFLFTMPDAFHAIHGHVNKFADTLIGNFPVHIQLHQFYRSYASGYQFLVQRSAELGSQYGGLNAGDVMRRLSPRMNESWADAGNKRV